MAFLAPDDILFLEKNDGLVNRVTNGKLSDKPLLDLNVVHSDGLLGIAVSKNESDHTYVFLYFTQSLKEYGADITNDEEVRMVNNTFGKIRECNCLYRYELIDDKLVYPKLLLSLPAGPGGQHHGGEILIGDDGNIYVLVGNIEGWMTNNTSTKAQNYENGSEPDGRAGILRVTQDGKPVDGGIIGNTYPLNLYYAYGIRNGFGMDFDPITGNLWDTENGPDYGDEINLVEPGFNSGGDDVYGISTSDKKLDPRKLVDFNGKGHYSDPEFVWNSTVGPTALRFVASDKYGDELQNDMLVGDINNGNIYHFELNNERDMLLLNGTTADKVANNKEELEDIIFMKGFQDITDVQISPDGYIYVLGNKSIYKIEPKEAN
jgi:glucose/arabinose dehydrogenase